MIYSNCCKEMIFTGTDICCKCGNHCSAVKPCPSCDGSGKQDREFRYLGRVAVKTVTCLECEGEGYIESDFEDEDLEGDFRLVSITETGFYDIGKATTSSEAFRLAENKINNLDIKNGYICLFFEGILVAIVNKEGRVIPKGAKDVIR